MIPTCTQLSCCSVQAETTPPALVGAPAVRWSNTEVAKIEWETDEESRSILRVKTSPSAPAVWSGEEVQYKKHHVMVARGLIPGETMTLEIETEDPASPPNTATQTFSLTPQGLFQSVHVEETRLDVGTQNGDGTYPLTATFKIVDAGGQPVSGTAVSFNVFEWPDAMGNTVTDFRGTVQAGPNPGEVTRSFDSTLAGGTDVFVEIVARSVVDITGNRFYFHALNGKERFWDQQPLPP